MLFCRLQHGIMDVQGCSFHFIPFVRFDRSTHGDPMLCLFMRSSDNSLCAYAARLFSLTEARDMPCSQTTVSFPQGMLPERRLEHSSRRHFCLSSPAGAARSVLCRALPRAQAYPHGQYHDENRRAVFAPGRRHRPCPLSIIGEHSVAHTGRAFVVQTSRWRPGGTLGSTASDAFADPDLGSNTILTGQFRGRWPRGPAFPPNLSYNPRYRFQPVV